MKHRRMFNNIWKSFELVAWDCVEHGGKVAIEWPASCFYWRFRKVKRFIRDYGLSKSRFDGCMYGLASCRPGCVGMKLKKPWAFAINAIEIPFMFVRKILKQLLCRW